MMGILRFQDVTDWQLAAQKELRGVAHDPDTATPIGRRASSPTKHTATWIRLDPSTGKPTYGQEKAIEVYRGHEKLLPAELQQKLGIREIRGWLFQVRDTGPNPQLNGKEILLSKLPHSRNYFIRRTLKRCKHEKSVWKRVERAWDNDQAIELADVRLDRVLQDLAITPFVHVKGCRAAWAVTAERFEVLGKERFDALDDYTIAALDVPFEQAYELLRVDPLVQHALDVTQTGQLFDGYRPVEDVRAAIRHGFRPSKGPVKRHVTEALCENSDELMRVACYAALCGREVPDANDSVADSAVLLYHRFAYNFVDREKHPFVRRRQVAKEVDGLPAEHSELKLSEPFAEEESIREYTTQWRDMGFETAGENLIQLVAYILRANEDEIAEEFVSTLRPPLAGWPAEWELPEGFEQALRRLNQPGK